MAKAKTTKSKKLTKGVSDGTFGQAASSNAIPPKALRQVVRSLKPVEAYMLCSAVRACISARCALYSQINIRVFEERSGKEITSGEIFDFCQHPNAGQSGPQFLQAIASYNDLTDERIVKLEEKDGKKTVQVLNPLSARVMKPTLPRVPEDIEQWMYIYDNGQIGYSRTEQKTLIPAEDICFEHEWNPSSNIRGMSKLLAVINSITSYNNAQKYIRAYFQNNAQPSTLINVETDSPENAEAWKQEFLSEHGGEENAFKTMVTFGGKVTATPLSSPASEAPFQQLLANVKSEVASIYMTPPLVSGEFDKTRFDSVDAQCDYFIGNIWLPGVEKIQGFMQRIIDKWFATKSAGKLADVKLTKGMSRQLKKATANAKSNYIVVLDTEHIPDVARLAQHKVNYAMKLIETAHMTPQAAFDYVGLDDLPLNPTANLVWYKSDQKFIDPANPFAIDVKTETKAPVVAANAIEPVKVADTTEPVSSEEVEETVDPESVDKAKQFLMKLRKLALTKNDAKESFTLAEADNLLVQEEISSDNMRREVRRIYFAINKSKEDIKKTFNTASKISNIKSILRK